MSRDPKPTPPPRREPTQDERDHSDLRYGPKPVFRSAKAGWTCLVNH